MSNSRETEHNEELVLSDDPAMQGRAKAVKNPAEGGDIREEASPEARMARQNAGGEDEGGGAEGRDPVTAKLDQVGTFEGSMSHGRDDRKNPDGEKGAQRVPAVGKYETSGTEAPAKEKLGKDW